MKKIILVLLLLLLTTQTYGWWVEIYTPRGCPSMPTPIIASSYPHTWQCQFEIHEGFPVMYQYNYEIRYVQNGQETTVTSGYGEDPNQVITANLTINGYQYGPHPNQLCNLKIYVQRISDPPEYEQAIAYFVAYTTVGSSWSTDLLAAINGSSTKIFDNKLIVFFRGNPCGLNQT